MAAMGAQGALVPFPAQAVPEEQPDLADRGGQGVKAPQERGGGPTAIQVWTAHLAPQALTARPWQGRWRWRHAAVKDWAAPMVLAPMEAVREAPVRTPAAAARAASRVSQAW